MTTGTKAILTFSEKVKEDGEIEEILTVEYEPELDAAGMVVVRSNVLGMARVVQELFRCGALQNISFAFVPASFLEQKNESVQTVQG